MQADTPKPRNLGALKLSKTPHKRWSRPSSATRSEKLSVWSAA